MSNMRKIYIGIISALVLCSGILNIGASGEELNIILEERFTDWFNQDNPLPGWSSLTPGTFWTQGPIYGEPSHSPPHHAYAFAMTASMITPDLLFGEESTFSFWYAAELSSTPQNLELYLDDTGDAFTNWDETDPDSWPDPIWSDYNFNHEADDTLPDNGYQYVELSLGEEYAGKTINFMFYHPGPTDWVGGMMVDDIQVRTTGEVTSIDEDTDGNGGNTGNDRPSGGSPSFTPEDMDRTDQLPIADASAGEPYVGVVGQEIEFDGSASISPDDSLLNYTWDFGDGTSGYGLIVSHVYLSAGEYTVTLTVINQEDAQNVTETTATIYDSVIPPSKPQVKTPFGMLTVDQEYPFIAVAEDEGGDTISYVFDWGDATETITDFYESGVVVNVSHGYSSAGVYTVQVHAVNSQNASSDSTSVEIFVDVTIVTIIDDIIYGYLVDYSHTGEDIWFYNEETGLETPVEIVIGESDYTERYLEYLIDINGDGSWEYMYNTRDGLSVYRSPEPDEEVDDVEDTPGFKVMLLLAVLFPIIGFKKIRLYR